MQDTGALLRAVGRRVAELREVRGITQEQLAVLLDVTAGYVRQVERGVKNLSIRSLVVFTNALDATVADLFVPPTTPPRRRGRPRRRAS